MHPKERPIPALTVLVCDDDGAIVQLIEVNLRLDGFAVITAREGQEAFGKAVERQPNLIVLDAWMPNGDGYTVCARLRADPRSATIPVLMLTADPRAASQTLARNAGADDCLLKPFDPAVLLAKVNAMLPELG